MNTNNHTFPSRKIADDILCLAHTYNKTGWCDRAETCERHVAIRRNGIGDGFGLLFRVCQPESHDQFIQAKP